MHSRRMHTTHFNDHLGGWQVSAQRGWGGCVPAQREGCLPLGPL